MRAARPALAQAVGQIRRAHIALSPMGALPSVIVIGAQKSGTTSLFQALAAHPQVSPSRVKETHFFDLHWTRGEPWYRRCFPPTGRGVEATPAYLFHPHAPARLAACVPGARLIAVLRDPLARAASHHAYETRRGTEHLPLIEALAAEPARTDADYARALTDPLHWPVSLQRHSYLRRGLYAAQLARWRAMFGDALMVVEDRALHRDPQATLASIQDHARLDRHALSLPHANAGTSRDLTALDRFRVYFDDDRAALKTVYGDRLSWLS